MEVEDCGAEMTPHLTSGNKNAPRTSDQQEKQGGPCPSAPLQRLQMQEQRRKLLKRTQILPTGAEQSGTSWAKMAPVSKKLARRMLPGSDKQYEDLMNRQGKASTRKDVLGGWAALQGQELPEELNTKRMGSSIVSAVKAAAVVGCAPWPMAHNSPDETPPTPQVNLALSSRGVVRIGPDGDSTQNTYVNSDYKAHEKTRQELRACEAEITDLRQKLQAMDTKSQKHADAAQQAIQRKLRDQQWDKTSLHASEMALLLTKDRLWFDALAKRTGALLYVIAAFAVHIEDSN